MDLISSQISFLNAHCIEHHVKNMWVFGSAINMEKFNEQSDIDLIVEFEPFPILEYADNYFELKDKLEVTLNHPVDLLTSSNLSNPYFVQEVNRTKKLIFTKEHLPVLKISVDNIIKPS